MSSKRGRWLAAAATFVVSVGTFVGSGTSPLYVDKGLDVSLQYVHASHALVIRRDGPDLKCWMRVRAHARTPLAARLSNGLLLDIRADPADSSWLAVSEPLTRGERWPRKMNWPSGLAVVVQPLEAPPDGWAIYPETGEGDSDWRTRRRIIFMLIAAITLIAGALTAVSAVLYPTSAATRPTAVSILDSLTDELEGNDEDETRIMRRFIRDASNVGFKRAYEALDPGKARRVALRAHTLLIERLGTVLRDLQALRYLMKQ
jgi:hypothetical protein